MSLKAEVSRLQGAAHDLVEIEELRTQADLSLRDARYVQEIIDEAGEMLDLARDHGQQVFGFGRVGLEAFQRLEGIAHGGQRIAQLMGEHSQEFILAAVGFAQLALQLVSVDGVRGVARHDVDEPQIAPGELARLSKMHGEHAHQICRRAHQRGRERRPEARRARFLQDRGGGGIPFDIRDHDLLTRFQHATAGRAVGGVDRRKMVDEALLKASMRCDVQSLARFVVERHRAETAPTSSAAVFNTSFKGWVMSSLWMNFVLSC